MFWECSIVNVFWKMIEIWLNGKLNINIQISYKNVFLGFTNHQRYLTVNHVLLCAKYYLYKNRFSKDKPSTICFKNILCEIIKQEKGFFFKKNRIEDFDKKWEGFV